MDLGDNIDTDVIIPARYLNTTDPQELAAHCLEDANPEFSKRLKRRYHCCRKQFRLWEFS